MQKSTVLDAWLLKNDSSNNNILTKEQNPSNIQVFALLIIIYIAS